jgi:hypothetical protein
MKTLIFAGALALVLGSTSAALACDDDHADVYDEECGREPRAARRVRRKPVTAGDGSDSSDRRRRNPPGIRR